MKSIFRWMPTAVILWFFGVVLLLFGIMNLNFAVLSENGALPRYPWDAGLTRTFITRNYWKGGIKDCLMGILCLMSWHFMRQRTRTWMMCAALAMASVLTITVARWLYWELRGQNFIPWGEPLFVWPFFCYAGIYAFRESRTAPDI
jgi:hypothetical protein